MSLDCPLPILKTKKETTMQHRCNMSGLIIDPDCNNSLTLKNPIMELKIDIPNGYEIDTEKSTLGHLILKEINKSPKWEDFGEVKGFYVDTLGDLEEHEGESDCTNQNVFPSREEAEACVALSQLLQWRDKYNEGWKADWRENNVVIRYRANGIEIYNSEIRSPLSFKSRIISEKFLSDFQDLIEIAKPLL